MLVPDGWAPRRGSRVIVHPTRDDPDPPAGRWHLFEKSPDGPGWWWAQPVDDESRAWAARHPRKLTSGCLSVAGNRLTPPGHKPRPVERKGGRR